MTIDSSPPGRLPPMAELGDYLIERVDADLARKFVEREKFEIAIVRSRKIALSNGDPALALLFTFADPDAPDPANIHLPTRRVRRFDKEEGEARGYSAHAILCLTPTEYGGRRFRVLLESAERLGKSRVSQMLDYQFRAIFQSKEIVLENDKGDEVAAKPKVRLDTVTNDRLRDSVSGGVIKSLKLIDPILEQSGFDPPEGVRIRRREMFLKVDVPPGQQVQSMLKHLQPWARSQGFREIYVEWLPEHEAAASAGKLNARNVERAKIDLAQRDIGETLFAKKAFVSVTRPLTDLSTEFSDELLDAMAALME
ncbi:hypothetical protein [Sphingobium sp. RSMS]|uniref:hypothetical protein n=1 Tax=Sphingobium sp. RSMS TaxID=520734 RepID=UPI0010F44E6E|nr:hypothetical protein [Sphingobium sp. RSMS]